MLADWWNHITFWQYVAVMIASFLMGCLLLKGNVKRMG